MNIFRATVHFLHQKATTQNRPTVQFTILREPIHRFHPQPNTFRLHAWQCCAIDELIRNSCIFYTQKLLTIGSHAKSISLLHTYTRTHTLALTHTHSYVVSVVLHQMHDVSKLNKLVSRSWIHKNKWQAKQSCWHRECKSTFLASRNSDCVIQGQQSHTQSGEVCVGVQKRRMYYYGITRVLLWYY